MIPVCRRGGPVVAAELRLTEEFASPEFASALRCHDALDTQDLGEIKTLSEWCISRLRLQACVMYDVLLQRLKIDS